jgi:MSHA pilin protein MshD
LAVNASVRGSADPVLQRQLLAVTQQHGGCNSALGAGVNAPVVRPHTFNDLLDYHGYSGSVCRGRHRHRRAGGHHVSISVADGTLGGVAAARRITVTVARGGQSITLTGWRTDHAS